MNTDIFNVERYRVWGLAPLAALSWHGVHTAMFLSYDYLFFVCYSANLLLGMGILMRSGLMVGTGYGWLVVALPLWLYDSAIHSDWELSSAVFHLCGIFVGTMAVKRFCLPRYTWFFAVSFALALQFLSRQFTDSSLNVNAAFRVYDGWEGLFTEYWTYLVSMLAGFSIFFMLLVKVNNKYMFRGDAKN